MTAIRLAILFAALITPAALSAQVVTIPRSDLSVPNGVGQPVSEFAVAGETLGASPFASHVPGQAFNASGPMNPLTTGYPGMPDPSGALMPTGPGGAVPHAFPSRAVPQAAARARYSSPLWQSSSRGGHFGVMGAIARPGVYFHSQERLTLRELLQLAGGPSTDASGSVRIVRQGRGGLQAFLTPESPYELLNGDVIVVESRRSAPVAGMREFSGGQSRPVSTSTSPATEKQGASPAWVAFVNLRAEPIIVPVPADQVTVSAVIGWLRQDPRTPPSIRVIPPSPQIRREAATSDELLESGTVLVFDPATVKKERLPDFPPVIGAPETETPEAAIESASPSGRTNTPKGGRDGVSTGPRGANSTSPGSLGLDRSTPDRPASDHPLPGRSRPGRAPAPPASIEIPTGPRLDSGRIDSSRLDLPLDVNRSGQSEAVLPRESLQSASGGPMLMMPTNQTNSQELKFDQNPGQAPHYGTERPVQRTSENPLEDLQNSRAAYSPDGPQRPGMTAPGMAATGYGSGDVLQVNAEIQELDFETPAVDGLEMPRPVPHILPDTPEDPQAISAEVSTPASLVPSSSKGRQMVWISCGSMLLLFAIFWYLLGKTGVRPALAMVRRPSRQTASAPQVTRSTNVFKLRTSVIRAEGQPILRTDLGGAGAVPVTPQPSEPAPATELPTLPPPLRTISEREHALRAHFRQSRQERSARTLESAQKVTASFLVGEHRADTGLPAHPSDPSAVIPSPAIDMAADAGTANSVIANSVAASPAKASVPGGASAASLAATARASVSSDRQQDVLDRALSARRASPPSAAD